MSSEDRSLYRTIAKSGGVAFVGRFAELGISFVGAAIIARLIGPTDFGSITIGKTILSTVGSIVLLGLTTGITRYVPRSDDESDKRGVLVSSFQIVIPFSILVAAGLFLAADWLADTLFSDPSIATVIRIFVLAIPLSAVTDLGIAASKGHMDSLPQVYIKNISLPVARLTLAAVVLILAPSAPGIAWAYVLAYVASAGLSLYYLYTRTNLFERIGYTPQHRRLLSYSTPLVFSVLMAQLLSDIDTFMLGYFAETADVGIYGTIYPLASLLMIFNTSINHLSIPVISELHSSERYDEMNRIFRVVTKWIVLSTLPIFFVFFLFPRTAIFLTYGPEYVAGGLALSVLVLGFMPNIVVGPAKQTLSSIGDTRTILYIGASAAVLNVILNLVLVPRYSYLGASVATAISYAALHGLQLLVLYRRTGIHPFTGALLRPVLAVTIVTLSTYAALSSLVEMTLFIVLLACVAFAPVYVFVVLRFGGIEREEVDLVLDLEHKFDVDLTPLKRIANRVIK